jgi:hypothetical protein
MLMDDPPGYCAAGTSFWSLRHCNQICWSRHGSAETRSGRTASQRRRMMSLMWRAFRCRARTAPCHGPRGRITPRYTHMPTNTHTHTHTHSYMVQLLFSMFILQRIYDDLDMMTYAWAVPQWLTFFCGVRCRVTAVVRNAGHIRAALRVRHQPDDNTARPRRRLRLLPEHRAARLAEQKHCHKLVMLRQPVSCTYVCPGRSQYTS